MRFRFLLDDPCADTDVLMCPGLHIYCDNENVIEKCPKTCNKCSKYSFCFLFRFSKNVFCVTLFATYNSVEMFSLYVRYCSSKGLVEWGENRFAMIHF